MKILSVIDRRVAWQSLNFNFTINFYSIIIKFMKISLADAGKTGSMLERYASPPWVMSGKVEIASLTNVQSVLQGLVQFLFVLF